MSPKRRGGCEAETREERLDVESFNEIQTRIVGGWMLTFAYLTYSERLISYSTCQTAYLGAHLAATCRASKKTKRFVRSPIFLNNYTTPLSADARLATSRTSTCHVANFTRVDYTFPYFFDLCKSFRIGHFFYFVSGILFKFDCVIYVKLEIVIYADWKIILKIKILEVISVWRLFTKSISTIEFLSVYQSNKLNNVFCFSILR